MTSAVFNVPTSGGRPAAASVRAGSLADRLTQGARALAVFAGTLTNAEWETSLLNERRTVGVVVHHVGNMYPIEIQLALAVAGGQAVTGMTMLDVHAMNAAHAVEKAAVTKNEAIEVLLRNSADADAAIRALTDDQLDRAATVSLYDDAPVTCQFLLEDHAVRHSYHHLAGIREAVRR
jgi:hypothetical protein